VVSIHKFAINSHLYEVKTSDVSTAGNCEWESLGETDDIQLEGLRETRRTSRAMFEPCSVVMRIMNVINYTSCSVSHSHRTLHVLCLQYAPFCFCSFHGGKAAEA